MSAIKSITILLLLLPVCLLGQTEFANTVTYKDGQESPEASLTVINWLQGHWVGEAFGGIVEEVWSAPLGGSMMGAFKLVVNNMVKFYELETISEEGKTLVLRLKHFGADLKGWEEKDKTVDFRLVKVAENKVFFDGFTIEKISDDEINMYVVIANDKKKEEVKFNYRRK